MFTRQLTVMMTELMGELSPYQVFLLGRLDAAHSTFKFIEVKAKEAKVALEKVPRGPGLESVGDFYDGLKREAEDQLSMRVTQRVEAEKFFRKCRHELVESGVDLELIAEFLRVMREAEAKE